MSPQEQQAILTIALMAALADGDKADIERESLRGIAESLGGKGGLAGLAAVYQDVLLRRVDLGGTVARLGDPGQRELAYEMAVCVCDADGARSPAEAAFLADLKARLKPDAGEVAAFERAEAELVQAAAVSVPATVAATAAVAPEARGPDNAALDKSILNYALLNGALELLPQSWASMAIIPLQVKMVYEVGKAHGVELDQGHIREFIAAVGVGLTSQYLEQFGRKLIGLLVRDHLRAGPGGQALLRGWTADEHRSAQADLPGPAGAGEADAGAVPAADPAEGGHAGRRAGDGAGARSLIRRPPPPRPRASPPRRCRASAGAAPGRTHRSRG
jgi:hypothetical protein